MFRCCDSLVFNLGMSARKPTHIPVRLAGHPGRRVTFSCSCKRKSPKRTRPRCRAGAARRCATGERVRSTGLPGLTIESARSLAPPACPHAACPFALRRGTEGFRRTKQRRWVPAFAGTTEGVCFCFPGPSRPRRGCEGNSPSGARARCARVRCQAMDGLSANLRSALAQSPASSAAAVAWVASFWLLSLARQRKYLVRLDGGRSFTRT
jgi:hypothetical protein